MFLDMLLQTIIDIAAKCGWSVTVSVIDVDCTAFDFRRRTRSGVPFCFCADMTGGNTATLLDDILSFIDAFNPRHSPGSGANCRVPGIALKRGLWRKWTICEPKHGFSPLSCRKPSPPRNATIRRGISGTDRDYSPLRRRRAIISIRSLPVRRVIPLMNVGLGNRSSWSKQ